MSNPPLRESVSFIYHQSYVDRLQRMTNHEHVTQENETLLIKDWTVEITMHGKYKAHRDEFI